MFDICTHLFGELLDASVNICLRIFVHFINVLLELCLGVLGFKEFFVFELTLLFTDLDFLFISLVQLCD